jgi:uncharacterized protein involved in tellurium resistance
VRRAASGAEETRLYFTWKGGTRKEADLQLFRKAGIDVGTGMIFHFYPKDTENALAVLELAHGKRKVQEIRRTYFAVKSESGGQYGFVVARQILLR